ncbi:MAG: hypothetical protein QM582_11620 [Micropruina sp.]|uniref:hypothetical protein n=1 Tax=Micropruina sp. TaxID=2737536 RepID=UPI0039E4784E
MGTNFETVEGAATTRVGGRPRQVDVADIVRAGRELGLRDLSLNAVAARLGVTATALYRHVDGRWGLERLVGESLLDDLVLVDDPAHDTLRHLLSFGLQLRTFIVHRPGLAGYLQTLFPRGASGRRLMADELAALVRRGYAEDAAIVLSSAVASLAIGYAAAEEAQRDRADGLDGQRDDALAGLRVDERLAPGHADLPVVESEEYVRLMLTAAIGGLLAAAPPGRPVRQIVAELRAAGEGA